MFVKLFVLAILNFVHGVDITVNPQLDASIFTAATQLDRLKLLPSDNQWVFDFTTQPSYTYYPGSVVNANAATFPAIVGNGMSLAMLNLGPCAMLPPHFHPRATNMVVAVAGNTNTYMIEENSARLVKETLTPGKMTIFPRASVHSMQNTGCGNATLISALNSEDPGTQNLLNSIFTLPFDIITAAFGNYGPNTAAFEFLQHFNLTNVPAVGTGSIIGSADCLAACANHGVYTGP